jgi:DNA-directed RNA polymerase subunit RPC12/RpoP
MRILNKKVIDLTPNKTIYRKLGRSGHGFNESIAELVDNSIDARSDEQINGEEQLFVDIIINNRDQFIEVHDNGKGMNEEEAAKSIVLAESHKSVESLGEYGFGMKTAALSLGKSFDVSTGKKGKNVGYYLKYDEDEFETDVNLNWHNYPFHEIEKEDLDDSGTNIRITNLKVKIVPNTVTNLKKDLAKRYKGHSKSKEVVIKVNGKSCPPMKIDWSKGYPKEFDIEDKKGNKIHCIAGLMKEGSQRGLYGFDLFRKKRMITSYQKFGIPEHATSARIMGEIYLDHVPVTHEKNKFIEESEEYQLAEVAVRDSEEIKSLVREARKKAKVDTVTDRVKEEVDKWQDYIAEAFKDSELRSFAFPNASKKSKKTGGDEPIRDESGNEENVDIEKRESPENTSDPNPESIEKRNRTPKQIQKSVRHVVRIGDKVFKFKHDCQQMGADFGRKDVFLNEKEGIIIYTNIDFPAWLATKDKPFYSVLNVAEGIAEIYVEQSTLDKTYKNVNEIKDLALRKASEIKNQFEEPIKKQKKNEMNHVCKDCGSELPEKSRAIYCADCSRKKLNETQAKYYKNLDSKGKKTNRILSNNEISKLIQERQKSHFQSRRRMPDRIRKYK